MNHSGFGRIFGKGGPRLPQVITQWARSVGLERWILAVFLFCAALAALTMIRRLLWAKLSRWARASDVAWDELLLARIRLPVQLLTLFIAIAIGLVAAPPEWKAEPHVEEAVALRICFIGTGIWIADRCAWVMFKANLFPGWISSSGRTLFFTLGRILILSVGFLVALDTAGISVTPILASLGVGSVAVALALQETLSNFFSGIYLLVDEPVKVGDFVQVEGGIEGFVTHIGWRSTHIRTLFNNFIVLPNSKLASAKITNYYMADRESAVVVEVGVSYGSDLERVERVATEVAAEVQREVEGAVRSFTPFIRYHTLNQSSIDFSVTLRSRQYVDQYLIRHEFIKRLHRRFTAEGIEIPFPQQVLHLAGGGSVVGLPGIEPPPSAGG